MYKASYTISQKEKGPDFPVVAVQANALHEPVNISIDKLTEGQETVLKINLES